MKVLKIRKAALLMTVGFALTAATNVSKETERISKSTEVLAALGKIKEGIPKQLLTDCEGVIVIPRLINASVGLGAKHGKGVGLVKMADGKWSNPVFISLTGGSIGFQAGVQSVDLVLVFKHKGVLTKVKDSDFTIGGDISVAAGPVGRSSSAGTDHKLEAEIYSYSRSRGMFAGISISGSNLSIDKSANANFYGEGAASQTTFETAESTDDAVKKLKATLSSL